jgi:nitrous-oxide reductase
MYWLTGLAFVAGLALTGCKKGSQSKKNTSDGGSAGQESIQQLMKERELSEKDVRAALKTYQPTGQKDSHLMVASGGHSGQAMLIGIPSMRILKIISVFTPEPWQGYGYGGNATEGLMQDGKRFGDKVKWGDTHHPALSETDGEYDGDYMFINDKNSARIAVIRMKDFTTKQIVTSELIQNDHGSTFVTPNTEWVVQGAQYAAPLGGDYAPIGKYKEKYRGAVIFWKFNREKGRLMPDKSFAIELPPYMQDLADAGKKASKGWVFLNSFNTEMATGGNLKRGNPPMESGASQNDMDFLHMINLEKAAKVAQNSENTETIADMPTIPLETAVKKDLLYFAPEPKSPHGVDVTPDGEELIVSGKLDTHATVYDFKKMRKLMKNETFDRKDPYGVPVLPYKKSIRGQLEIGLGPLHTQFDGNGNAYTSVFISSKVAKWDYENLEMIDKHSIHYNVGHISVAAGDTVDPEGKYLVSLNKWAKDRFNNVGPLHPQNFQLFDITGEEMELLYDLPIPFGEPHYAQIIKADKVRPKKVYKTGTDPVEHEISEHATEPGDERIVRKDDGVHVYMTVVRSHYKPDTVRVKEGEKVHLHLTNVEQAADATHGFGLSSHNVSLSLEPGEYGEVTFTADKPGVWPFYCTEFCSALHLEMTGYLLVEPKEA